MRTKRLVAMMVFSLSGAFSAIAAPNALVDVVQSPAWVERLERRLPLAPGMALENRDRIVTGAGARVIVQLADGSSVKLGENANVSVNAMKQEKDQGSAFHAALDVAKGAFRLTTDIFRKYQQQRAINVRVGTVTAGIRGTDLWGRSNDEKDFICLIEGKIAVSHPLGEPTELTEPLQFYGADKGGAPGPVASVDRVQLAKWAMETELQYGMPTQQTGGRWALNFGRHDKDATLALYDRLAGAGYASRIRPVPVSGGYEYEVRLGHLLTEQEARRLADQLVQDLDLPAPAVSRH